MQITDELQEELTPKEVVVTSHSPAWPGAEEKLKAAVQNPAIIIT